MIQKLRTIWFKVFPIGREKAVKIAMKSRVPDTSQFRASESPPGNMNIYLPYDEPCWYVTAPRNVGMDGNLLRNSRIILISKKTGRVLYDGSANDEG